MNIKIDFNDVKKLRELTGAGFDVCKKALVANNCDFKAAQAYIMNEVKKQYISKFGDENLANQDAKIPNVFISIKDDRKAVKFCFIKTKSDIVGLSKETHEMMYCALNEIDIKTNCFGDNDSENTKLIQNTDKFKKSLDDILSYYREPIAIESISGYMVSNPNCEVLGYYIHNKSNKNINSDYIHGQKCAIISLKFYETNDIDKISKISQLADLISMSIIGNESANVLFEEEINQTIVEEFKLKIMNDPKNSSKPANILENIVKGQMKKFFEENALIHSQLINPGKLEWLKVDSDISIKDSIESASRILGTNITIEYYRIFRSI